MEGKWKCRFCGKDSRTRAEMYGHLKREHMPDGQYMCPYCGLGFKTGWKLGAHSLHCRMHPNFAENLETVRKSASRRLGIRLSQSHREKISEGMRRHLLEHPDRTPYLLNHSSRESYPEAYFRKAFANEGFPPFVQDLYVRGYFLDFAFEGLHLYVEIDGEQHFTDPRISAHDRVRTARLASSGWKCACRIRWSRFKRLPPIQKSKFMSGLKLKIAGFAAKITDTA